MQRGEGAGTGGQWPSWDQGRGCHNFSARAKGFDWGGDSGKGKRGRMGEAELVAC